MRRNEACASFVAFAVRTQVIELSGGDGVFGVVGVFRVVGVVAVVRVNFSALFLSLSLYLSASAKGIFTEYSSLELLVSSSLYSSLYLSSSYSFG